MSIFPIRASYFNYPPYFGQVIYPASQLTQLEGKDITALKFYIANENGNVMNGGELSFFLGVVDVSEYSTISPFRIPESSLTLVGKLPMTPGEAEIVVGTEHDTAFALHPHFRVLPGLQCVEVWVDPFLSDLIRQRRFVAF